MPPRTARRGLGARPVPLSRRGMVGANRLTSRTEWAFLTGDDYPAGPLPAGEAEAMGIPAFGRGVALLANAVAGTAWWAERWNAEAGVSERVPDQPAVLNDPEHGSTPWHYRWATTEDLILYGNHFAICGPSDWRTRAPGELVPIPAHDVWVLEDPETGLWAFTVGGQLLAPMDLDHPSVDPVNPDLPSQYGRVFHVSAGNRSGEPLGRGVLSQYAAWLGGTVAAEVHAGNYFAGGALPPAVLQSPSVLTQAQAGELKAKWREMTSSREPVVLPAGYTLTPVVSNAEQAQLVESRQWNAAAVAMMLGIPSYKLGLAGPSMTYQNIESADIEFVRDSVDRYGHPLSQSFTKWLMPRGTSVEWDYTGRMRADQKTTSEVLATYVGAEILTHDEARATIGRPPLPEPPEPPAPTMPAGALPEKTEPEPLELEAAAEGSTDE